MCTLCQLRKVLAILLHHHLLDDPGALALKDLQGIEGECKGGWCRLAQWCCTSWWEVRWLCTAPFLSGLFERHCCQCSLMCRMDVG